MRVFSPKALWITRFAPIFRCFSGLSARLAVISYGVSACVLHERFLLFVSSSNYAGILHRRAVSQNGMQSGAAAIGFIWRESLRSTLKSALQGFRGRNFCTHGLREFTLLQEARRPTSMNSSAAVKKLQKPAASPETRFNVNYRIQH